MVTPNNTTPIQSVFAMTLSGQGPKVVPIYADMQTLATVEIDMSPLVQNGNIDFISGAYIDNSLNANALSLVAAGTNQKISVPANSQAYMPILAPNNPKFIVSSGAIPGIIIPIFFYNIPLLPYVFSAAAAATSGLTDAELRAAPVNMISYAVDYFDSSIAALSGASEPLMIAEPLRQMFIVQNIGANPIALNLFGGAAVINGPGCITLPAGASITLDYYPPTGPINIIGTAGQPVTALEA